ncbi:DUF1330 domain-containing protein [Streptomyces sp. NPDC059875]|uniref:DUF1330 domain-containing protein n=1 Tax=unclassified Streptomyces TaxID=2593676 RepID=UPI003669C7B3
MTAYAMANLSPLTAVHDEVLDYIDRMQSTLDPFGGRFLVHGAPEREVLEGAWPGDVVVLAFPSLDHARGWYDSAAYQEIKPLRTRHLSGDLLLIDGVPDGYDASATAARWRAASASGGGPA